MNPLTLLFLLTSDPSGMELSPEAHRTFVTKIQPLLENHCGKCHRGERDRFRIVPIDPRRPNPDRVRENLNMTLKQVRTDDPAQSPLLTRSLRNHGGGLTAPLKDRGQPSYKILEDWVLSLSANQPGTKPQTQQPQPGSPSFDPYDPKEFNNRDK